MGDPSERDDATRLFQELITAQVNVIREYVALLDASLGATGKDKENFIIEATIRLNLAKRFEEDLARVYADCVSFGVDLPLDTTRARFLYASARGVAWEEVPQLDFEELCSWLVKHVGVDEVDADQAAVWLLRAFEQAQHGSLPGVIDALRRARKMTPSTAPKPD
jgi:hypothetical protein